MSGLEIGQVIALKIRYNNSGTLATSNHPYLIVGKDTRLNTIEIAQMDSLAGKGYKAARRSNKTIFCDDPHESVIDRDSYVQLDNTIKVEDFPELIAYRRQEDKLSAHKLDDVLNAYHQYHERYAIDENKNVYMDKDEILRLNR